MSSNTSKLEGSSFRLPDGRDVEVVFLRDEHGNVTARTAEEIELLERADAARAKATRESKP